MKRMLVVVALTGGLVAAPARADQKVDEAVAKANEQLQKGKPEEALKTMNKLVSGTAHADSSLEAIIKATAGKPADAGLFNNAAQIWNHTFYWNSLRHGTDQGGSPWKKASGVSARTSRVSCRTSGGRSDDGVNG